MTLVISTVPLGQGQMYERLPMIRSVADTERTAVAQSTPVHPVEETPQTLSQNWS